MGLFGGGSYGQQGFPIFCRCLADGSGSVGQPWHGAEENVATHDSQQRKVSAASNARMP
jgi:hypothetical protein